MSASLRVVVPTLIASVLLLASGCAPESSPSASSGRAAGPVVTAEYTSHPDEPPSIRPAVYLELSDEETTSAPGGGELRPGADWPKPQLALFLTGRQSGYIEPCGCTGFATAKGGLSRRYTFLQELRNRGWNVVPLDVGNQVNRVGVEAELKFQTTIGALKKMEYSAIGLGPDDLRISIGELAVAVAGDNDQESLFVSANVDLLGMNARYRIVQVAGVRIGITGFLGKEERAQVNSSEMELTDAREALRPIVQKFLEEKCELRILLAQASLDETRQIAKEFPGEFGIILTAGGAGEPTREPELIPGTKSQMIQVGTKGMYVGLVGLYPPDVVPRMRYERVVLDARFPDSPEILDAFGLYQQQLKDLGLSGLGLRPVRFPGDQGEFVGHEVCGGCHTKAYEVFEESPHFHATESIANPTERSAIPRHFDPECISCHVTGWDPQGFFPYASGYVSLEKTPHLQSNGCENCHGPGSKHVAVEKGRETVSDDERKALRQQMRVTLEEAKTSLCYQCHDIDNSPEFEFDSYWEQIEHHGKD